MRSVARFALSVGTAALFAGCRGSQAPMSAGVIPQASAIASRTNSMNYKVVHSFVGAPDGQNPYAGLIDVGGTLYGTTYSGGEYHRYGRSFGTVFSITPSGTERVLHNFGAGSDGISPHASLIDVSGTLYGTTVGGSSHTCGSSSTGCGTAFSITPSGTEKVLHNFGSGPDGAHPAASLIEVNGTLYGTTAGGGDYYDCLGGCGTVFSITPSGTYKVLHRFHGYPNDGNRPVASLIEVKGKLYGTTAGGGPNQWGMVFSITLSGREKVLHNFGGIDGGSPRAALIDVRGTLYSTTTFGGAGGDCNTYNKMCGTVFSITLSGTEKVLHRFGNGTDGNSPVAPLIKVKDTLYGTTEHGGAYSCESYRQALVGGCGTVFSITPSGAEKVLHNFGSGTDGFFPGAALSDVDGILYGTTEYGGDKYCCGTVFAFTP